jgi:thiamine biosynthesis lipoprotein
VAVIPEPAAIPELKFRVMASSAHVILVDPARGAEDYARRRLLELEQRWSRFLPESDVSRMNGSPEAFMLVSSDTIMLLTSMKEAWRRTNGRYDPTMLSAIVAAGYSTSIDGSRRTCRAGARQVEWLTIDDVSINPVTSAVVVPAGIGIDPGGIGKGLAADIVVTELLAQGTAGALVCVGGDLAAAGTPPTPAGWLVNTEDPHDPSQSVATLALEAGGVATSSTLSRTWQQDGHQRHHVIDPGTQTCSGTDLAAVTVIARAGWEAEAHATAALLCGSEMVLEYLDIHELDGMATTLDGTVLLSPNLEHAGVAEGSFV